MKESLTGHVNQILDVDFSAEKICEMYANATKKEPNEELFSHLFMSYVRVSNYKKQQV